MKVKKYIENKPWGRYERYCLNQKCTVKILFLKPNTELSLQYHKNRNEFWKVAKGTGKVIINKKIVNAKEGDEFLVVRKTLHTIKAGKNGINVLEISFGNFSEKDIIRIKDKYKRK